MPTAAVSTTSKPVALSMANRCVTKTHSRPYVSDDNPYSESQLRWMTSTARSSRIASAASKTAAPFASSSSRGTTKSIATPASAC